MDLKSLIPAKPSDASLGILSAGSKGTNGMYILHIMQYMQGGSGSKALGKPGGVKSSPYIRMSATSIHNRLDHK